MSTPRFEALATDAANRFWSSHEKSTSLYFKKLLRELNELVSRTSEIEQADSAGKLIRLPTGDGMALVFRTELEAPPLKCAVEIARALKSKSKIQLRMGIHAGSARNEFRRTCSRRGHQLAGLREGPTAGHASQCC